MTSQPGPKILNMGQPGTGKTYALRTLHEAGVTPFVIFTEQSMETLGDLPPSECHWRFIPSRPGDLSGFIAMAKKINQLTMELLTKSRDPAQGEFLQFVTLLETLADFKCDRTGESFGAVDDWGPERCLVLDGLTGTSNMALGLVTAGRSPRSQPEWGVAMEQQLRLVEMMTDLSCSVIINAHISMERDEISGRVMQFASALGRKNAPELPRMFGEVLHSRRQGRNFLWDVASDEVATKTRLLPMRNDLPQDYGQIFAAWQQKGGILEKTP